MFGSETLDLAIGMVFVFLMLSLVASAVREAIEARLKARAKHLAHGLLEMLGDEGTVAAFYQHPLISALYDGRYDPRAVGYRGHRLFSWIPSLLFSFVRGTTSMPSYIPARTAALVIADLVGHRDSTTATAASAATAPKRVARVESAVERWAMRMLPLSAKGEPQSAGRLADALRALAPVERDVEQRLAALQGWYDASMDRVSGWFKRDTQHILFWLGLAIAMSLNVDAVGLAKYLASDRDARSQLVVQATREAHDAARPATTAAPTDEADARAKAAVRKLTDLSLPIGWTAERWGDFKQTVHQRDAHVASMLAGWLVTAFGISFGAPFWFDLLNRLMVIRSTVKPHEKSPEERSMDGGR